MAKKRTNPNGGLINNKTEKGGQSEKAATRTAEGGIMNTAAPAPCKAQYKQAPNERVISGLGCGSVVLGRDRPDSAASGYGGDGLVGADDKSIDASRVEIVVGRMSSARGGKGVKPGTFVDNSFAADAARIYICETTDVDKNFGLVEGLVGNAVGKSAIAIKSDHTRIIGREGIKIVTGRMTNIKAGPKGETNSKGGKLPVAPGIDLIAGNNSAPYTVRGPNLLPETVFRLQPVTVAFNMRDCMLELDGILDDITACIQLLGFSVQAVCGHAAAGFAALAVHPTAGAACAVAGGAIMNHMGLVPARVIMPLHQTRATKMAWAADYLQPYAYKFIGSRSVRATY